MREEFPLTWPFWLAGLVVAAGMVYQSLHEAATPARLAYLILALLLLVALGAVQVLRPR
jgi:hypothetical protein